MNELIKRFDAVYAAMVESKEVRKMQLWGAVDSVIFAELAEAHPEVAEKWLDALSPICYNNYLSDCEAEAVVSVLEAQDGTVGAKWDKDTFVATIERLDGVLDDKPYYNDNALWATANMIYSDHANSIAEDMGYAQPSDVSADKMALSVYRKAVEKLKDADRPCFVRRYFGLE